MYRNWEYLRRNWGKKPLTTPALRCTPYYRNIGHNSAKYKIAILLLEDHFALILSLEIPKNST